MEFTADLVKPAQIAFAEGAAYAQCGILARLASGGATALLAAAEGPAPPHDETLVATTATVHCYRIGCPDWRDRMLAQTLGRCTEATSLTIGTGSCF